MKISELKKILETIEKQHGDMEIIYADRGFYRKIFQNTDDELFVSVVDVKVEYNTPLTEYDFSDRNVLVLRS